MSVRPIEIIGGGLAGLSLGLALRRADVPVTVLEAGHYPRHRVCGEFIAGLDEATIARLGLAPFLRDALPHREIAWFPPPGTKVRNTDFGPGNGPVRRQTLPSPAPGISRHTLDARLAEAFVAAGGRLQTGARATDVSAAAGRVFATGRRRARPEWIGLKLHLAGLPLVADLELHLGDQAYVGLARVDRARVNVCGLFRQRSVELRPAREAALLAHLRAARLDALVARIAAAEIDPESCCAVAGLGFDRPVGPSPEFRIGDACAAIAPFTGNGMAMAFQSAAIALDPLLAYARGEMAWTAAQTAARRGLRSRFRLRLAAARLLHGPLLRPSRQRWLTALARARLLPLRPLYAALH